MWPSKLRLLTMLQAVQTDQHHQHPLHEHPAAEAAAHHEPSGPAAPPAEGTGAGVAPSSMAFPPLEALAASVSAPEGVGTSGGGEVSSQEGFNTLALTPSAGLCMCRPSSFALTGARHCCQCLHTKGKRDFSKIDFTVVQYSTAAHLAVQLAVNLMSAHAQTWVFLIMPPSFYALL